MLCGKWSWLSSPGRAAGKEAVRAFERLGYEAARQKRDLTSG